MSQALPELLGFEAADLTALRAHTMPEGVKRMATFLTQCGWPAVLYKDMLTKERFLLKLVRPPSEFIVENA